YAAMREVGWGVDQVRHRTRQQGFAIFIQFRKLTGGLRKDEQSGGENQERRSQVQILVLHELPPKFVSNGRRQKRARGCCSAAGHVSVFSALCWERDSVQTDNHSREIRKK